MSTKSPANDSQNLRDGRLWQTSIEYRFKPCEGDEKRSRNKLGEDFIQALAEDFERHGAEFIEGIYQDDRFAAAQGHQSQRQQLDDLTDDQLLGRLHRLTEEAAPLLAKAAEDGDVEPEISRRIFPASGSTPGGTPFGQWPHPS
jgi:hypothetical protein